MRAPTVHELIIENEELHRLVKEGFHEGYEMGYRDCAQNRCDEGRAWRDSDTKFTLKHLEQ